ncbi:MAG TPA: tetratricopeptide repeat protein [Nitrospira sp.]|nr:tetratricopeptide repeat protein [Nitrospira sp.]
MGIDRSKVLHSAQLFASKGQFDAAISEWKKLSAESPGDGSIHNSIGDLHLKRNATADAVASFIQAANAFRAEGATLKAIATYKKVLKLDPSRYDMYRHLGDLNAERGLLSSAVQDYLTLGKYYLKERKTKEALDIYKRIVSQDPSNLDAQQRVAELCVQENMQDEATKVYLQLGRERSAQQRYAEAKEAYQAVLRIDPANSEAQQFIEHFEKTGGAPARPAKPGAAVAASTGEPADLLSEASRRIEEKQFAGAEAILNQMLTKEPGNPQVCQLLARLHLQQGQLQVALGEYRFLAGAALRAQDYGQAETLIAEFLAVEPNSVPLLELQGELYEEKGEIETAVRHYGKAIEVLLQHPEPGMPTLHEEIFEKVQSLAPDSPTVKKLAVLIRGNAPADHPAAAATTPASPPSNKGFVPDRAASDDASSATSAIKPMQDRHLAAKDPTAAHAQPVEAASPASPIKHAAPDGQRSTPAKPSRPAEPEKAAPTTAEQFQIYMKAGRPGDAEKWLGTVLNAKPDDAEAREYLGQILEVKGDGAGAALQYSRALELLVANPANTTTERLHALYTKVKELAPASPIVAKLAATFGPSAPASAHATSAPAQPVDALDPDTHYTLGVAYKNMGLLDEAKQEFALSMKGPEVFLDSCLMMAVCLKEEEQFGAASAQLERLLSDPRCQGAKAQAIRYELGLLYEKQEQWQLAMTMFEAIPTFHDVPQRLASIRSLPGSAHAAPKAFRYAN